MEMLLLYWSECVKEDDIVKWTLITEMDATKMQNAKKIIKKINAYLEKQFNIWELNQSMIFIF